MDVNFLGQPWHDGTNLDDFLADATGRPDPIRLRIAAAWGKRSGFRRVRPYLDAWRAAGGTVELVLGLSEGGATRQGLEEALEAADSVHLFHDVSGRTFHPKVYLAESSEQTDLFVGSNNLTAGGVYYNYEAAISVSVATGDLAVAAVMTQVHAWFDVILADPACCRELTATNLPTLLANPVYRIGDEDQRRKAAGDEPGAPEEVDAITPSVDEEQAPFFGRSQTPKKRSRHEPTGTPSTSAAAPASIPGGSSAPPVPPVAAATVAAATMRWSKKMLGTDAQQPPGANTKPTHNLRLSAAYHPIDISTYFRDDFFDQTDWHTDPSNSDLEYTMVDMEVSIHGVVRGTYEFRVDHDLDRVSDQGNVPTVLKWGPLSDYMRHNDHVGDWVVLEKLDNGEYTLKIVDTDPATR
jgi:hypothetical protein